MPIPLRFSLIRCSVDATRLAECDAGYVRAFGNEPFESIVIRDARSLAEGYNRGLARANGRFIIFSHDDAWPVSTAAIDRLAEHLDDVDVVGIAGSDVALSAAWHSAGHPHLHGHVLAPAAEGGVNALIWGAETALVTGIKLLDGCFIAARREAALSIGFDAIRYDGFHCYDADFSYRAYCSGLAVAVAADMSIYHRSGGDFGPTWQRFNERFVAAFGPALDTLSPGPHRKARAHFASIDEALRHVDIAMLRDVARRVRGGQSGS